MFYIYAIKSTVTNLVYVGFTEDIEERLNRHNSGTVKSTRPFKPFHLIHVELADTRLKARLLEKYFKSGYGKETLREIAAVVEWQTRRT